MDVKVVDSGPCRKQLEVWASGEEVAGDFTQVLQAYHKRGRVPGFRPGKAPLALIERSFAKDILEDAKDRAIPRIYQASIKQEGLHPVAIVNLTDLQFDRQTGLSFKVLVDVPPSFELPVYSGIPLQDETQAVTDEDVEASIKRIRERFGAFEAVADRAVAEGDYVTLDFTATSDGQPLVELLPRDKALAEGHDFPLLVGEDEFLPGFNAGLIGMAAGETREIPVTFPDDYRVAALAGRTASYRATVKSIRTRRLMDLTPEFLAMLQVESEEALRERLRGQMAADAGRREEGRRRDALIKHLVDATVLDIPQSVVEEERQTSLRGIIQRFTESGGTAKALQEHRDEVWQMATQTAVNRVKITYILARIAEAEGVTVSDEDVEGFVLELARQYRTPLDKFRKQLEKNNAMESIRSDVLNQKTLDLLLSKAAIA